MGSPQGRDEHADQVDDLARDDEGHEYYDIIMPDNESR